MILGATPKSVSREKQGRQRGAFFRGRPMPLKTIRLEKQSRYYARQLDLFKKWRCEPDFLRFVFTRSLAQRTAQDRTRNFQLASGMDKASRAAAKLTAAMRAANEDCDFFDERDFEAVERVQSRATSLASYAQAPGTASCPPAARRLYFVSAMVPYLRWKRPPIPAGRDKSEEGPMWDWLTDWERAMESVPLPDHDWHEDVLYAGGFTPKHLLRFRPMTKHVPRVKEDRKQTIWRWWRTQRRKPDLVDWIVDYGAAYIAWERRLHRATRVQVVGKSKIRSGFYVNEVGSEGPLRRGESAFVKSAARTVGMHCENTEAEVRDAWRKIRL